MILSASAQSLRVLPSRRRVSAYLYHLSPPLRGHEYVRVSIVRVLGAWDATIHPCDASGLTDYQTELATLTGSRDPADVLGYAGYQEF